MFSPLDRLIVEFDKGLRTLLAPAPTLRPSPADPLRDAEMSDADRRKVAGFMRVNHCGEVCAQALYQGQALTARDPKVAEALHQAAWEETEHLAWTEQRLAELGSRKSLLNPLWYFGSLGMGITAGLIGDRWNLGFLAETERQVGRHLDEHLRQLPVQDGRSRAILLQMAEDEARHATTAITYGAADLPWPVRMAMRATSKLMTTTTYWV